MRANQGEGTYSMKRLNRFHRFWPCRVPDNWICRIYYDTLKVSGRDYKSGWQDKDGRAFSLETTYKKVEGQDLWPNRRHNMRSLARANRGPATILVVESVVWDGNNRWLAQRHREDWDTPVQVIWAFDPKE